MGSGKRKAAAIQSTDAATQVQAVVRWEQSIQGHSSFGVRETGAQPILF